MPEPFTVPFHYNGRDLEAECVLRISAFTYQILCTVEGYEYVVERDDEGNFRVVGKDPFSSNAKKSDTGMIQTFLEEMERILQ